MTATMLLQLPEDILTNIFKQLRFQDIYSLMLTCKTVCNLIINDNVLWRSKAQSIHYSYEGPTRLILQTRRNNGPSRQHWYNNCRASYNWCKGYFKNKVILQHRTNYMPWLRLHHSEVLLVSVGPRLHCYALQGVPTCSSCVILQHRTNYMPWLRLHHSEVLLVSVGPRLHCYALQGVPTCSSCVILQHRTNYMPWLRLHHSEVLLVSVGPRLHCYALQGVPNCNKLLWKIEVPHVGTAAFNPADPRLPPRGPRGGDRGGTRQKDLWPLCRYKDIALDEDIGVRCLALNETADKLAVGPNGNNRPLLLDTTTKQTIRDIQWHNEHCVIYVTHSGHLQLLDVRNNAVVRTLLYIQWHNEHSVIYVTHSGHLQLLDVRNNAVVYTAVDPFQSTLYCVQTDGRRACVAGSSEYARCVLYDLTLVAAADRGLAACNFDVLPSTTFTRDYSDIFQSL
ncbi:putative F-box/WD-repeat protein [Operophtera brumata]|uniref:Putative F-box/WD-repeat protein n=1 Tax=Operophtera brumata TaxID=104452 RepID=A0A0L7LMA6_OPEBR|nr:putative F-box/WD-repeat protein [Operophtera brumata]